MLFEVNIRITVYRSTVGHTRIYTVNIGMCNCSDYQLLQSVFIKLSTRYFSLIMAIIRVR